MNTSDRFDELIANAKELLIHLANVDGPEITALKDKVSQAIVNARQLVEQRAEQARGSVQDVAVSIDDYVHDYPWLAVGSAVAIAGTIGFLAGATITRRKGLLTF